MVVFWPYLHVIDHLLEESTQSGALLVQAFDRHGWHSAHEGGSIGRWSMAKGLSRGDPRDTRGHHRRH